MYDYRILRYCVVLHRWVQVVLHSIVFIKTVCNVILGVRMVL